MDIKTQPISLLMSRQVWSIGFEDSVQNIESLFNSKGLAWAPVLEPGGAIVGVLSAADLVRFHATGKDAATVQAWQLCSYKPFTVPPDTPAETVARWMIERDIHHVVVARNGGLEGVVSTLDLVRGFIGDAPIHR